MESGDHLGAESMVQTARLNALTAATELYRPDISYTSYDNNFQSGDNERNTPSSGVNNNENNNNNNNDNNNDSVYNSGSTLNYFGNNCNRNNGHINNPNNNYINGYNGSHFNGQNNAHKNNQWCSESSMRSTTRLPWTSPKVRTLFSL